MQILLSMFITNQNSFLMCNQIRKVQIALMEWFQVIKNGFLLLNLFGILQWSLNLDLPMILIFTELFWSFKEKDCVLGRTMPKMILLHKLKLRATSVYQVLFIKIITQVYCKSAQTNYSILSKQQYLIM